MHKVRALRIACLFFPIALACAHASQALVTTGSQEVREAIEARSREIYEKAGPWLFLLTAENLTGTVDAVGTELNGPLFNGRVARITPSAWSHCSAWWRAENNSSWVLGVGVVAAIFGLAMPIGPAWIANGLLMALFLSEIVRLGLQLYYYRKGM